MLRLALTDDEKQIVIDVVAELDRASKQAEMEAGYIGGPCNITIGQIVELAVFIVSRAEARRKAR